MFTDMVGFSALAQRNEALALELLEEHRRIVRDILPKHGGREVKTTGDGFLIEFPSALAAVQAAVAIQQAFHEREQTALLERRVRLRIGIHVGDVVLRAGDIHGDGVNIAARLEPLAPSGGICVSNAVYEQVRNKLEQAFASLGPAELKNIELPMAVHRVVLPWESAFQPSLRRQRSGPVILAVVALALLAGGSWWLLHPSRPAPPGPGLPATNALPTSVATDTKAIAVLPFANTSADKGDDSLSDGLTDELINTLQKVKGLRVQGRTSSFFFKGKNESLQKMGEQLGVKFLLEGSVSKAVNELRITADLIAVADGFQLWSTNYDRKMSDIFAIRSDVAQQVAAALKVQLGVEETENIAKKPTENLEAYDLYLRGRGFWNERTATDLQRAIDCFQQATEKDPKFALAYAGLAACYVLLPEYASVPMRDALPKARAAAVRALELDSQLAEAHAVLGVMKEFEWDWPGAEQAYRQAISLNPNYPTAHHWYGLLLSEQGRFEEASAELRTAKALDPLSAVIKSTGGEVFYRQKRFDEALTVARETIELDPHFAFAHELSGWVYLAQGKFPEAIAEFEKLRTLVGASPYGLGDLGHAYARAGRTNDAQKVLGRLLEIQQQGYDKQMDIAFVYLGLDDKDQTFLWLERSAENRDKDMRTLKVEPLWTELCADPRYAALLKKFDLNK